MPTQAPTVMVMMVETTTAAAHRAKRHENSCKLKGDIDSWSNDQMSELVSNHVHSYWTERRGRTPNKANAMLHVEQSPYFHKWTEVDTNTDFSQELDNKMKLKRQQLPQRNIFQPELPPPKTKHQGAKDSYAKVNKWWNVIKLVAAFMRPTARKFMCCDLLDCHSKKMGRFARKSQKDVIDVIRLGVVWLCDLHAAPGSYRTDDEYDCTTQGLCTNRFIRTAVANVLTFFESPVPRAY